MLKKMLLVASTTLITLPALAQSCRDIDVRDRMRPEVQQIFRTPYQQGNMGWCYAYATADLLTARLGKQVSPMHLSLVYTNSIHGLSAAARNMFKLNKSGFYEAGTVPNSFDMIRKRGYACGENSVRSEQDRYGMILRYLEAISQVHSGQADFLAQVNAEAFLEKTFPDISSEQALSYLQSRKTKTPAQALLNIAETACQADVVQIPKGLKLATKNKSSGDIFQFIDRGLNSYKPVSFLYNMRRLRSPELDKGFWMDNFSQHISTIVGRRKVGHQCVYIVRNSWGQTCDGYAQGIFCNQNEGTYQIPAAELERAIISAEYIAN